MRENLVGGGRLVKIEGGSGLGVEGVPNAKRGLIVQSASSHAVSGDIHGAGRYQLTQRAVEGTDLWRVKRIEPARWSASDAE